MNLQHDRIASLCEQLKFARLQSEWPAVAQDAAHPADAPVQRQFPEQYGLSEPIGGDRAGRVEHRDREGKIVDTADFGQRRRGQCEDHAAVGARSDRTASTTAAATRSTASSPMCP